MNIKDYWTAVLKQDKEQIRKYFNPTATICWHNTNEQFTVEEFLIANCEYPEKWDGEIEQLHQIDNVIITTTHVFATTKTLSFHVTSYIAIENNQIVSIDEYWGDDGVAPQWRLDKKIGQPIRSTRDETHR